MADVWKSSRLTSIPSQSPIVTLLEQRFFGPSLADYTQNYTRKLSLAFISSHFVTSLDAIPKVHLTRQIPVFSALFGMSPADLGNRRSIQLSYGSNDLAER